MIDDKCEQQDCQFYVDKIGTSEIHSIFVEAVKSTNRRLYLGASLCYVAGIEASIQGALARINGQSFEDNYGSTLSNALLRNAKNAGLPVEALSMKNDRDFIQSLISNKPNVEIVEVRHTIAHGNFKHYVKRDLCYFTSDLLSGLRSELEYISREWISRLSASKVNPFA